MRKYMPTVLISLFFCFITAYIAIYPSESLNAAEEGLKLWFNIVFPSLLPFFICVEILIGLGIVSLLGSTFSPLMRPVFNVPGEGSFGFFMSIASGYPVGARITAKLRQEKLCTAEEGQRLLTLCSTSGPLFIIGAVATGILGKPAIGFFLAICHYFSAITVGALMRLYGSRRKTTLHSSRFNPFNDMMEYRRKDGRNLGVLLGDAVKNGVNLIMMIGGFIILFSVITRVLKLSGILALASKALSTVLPFQAADDETVQSLLVGIMEVTNGVKECAKLQLSPVAEAVLVSFMLGFGGLSVNAQVLSIISETDLRFGIYLMMKLLQGLVASVYSYILFGLLGVSEAFNSYTASEALRLEWFSIRHWDKVFLNSSINLLLVMAFVLLVTMASKLKVFGSK